MNLAGMGMGAAVFLIIGFFHPLVIKGEYYFTQKIWKVFFMAGLLFLALSLWAGNDNVSILLGVLGFTCFWSIKEVKEQVKRVEKGWYPKNPKRGGKEK